MMSIQDAYDIYETVSDADRYTIVVHKGKASGNLIIHKEEHKDYEVAMERLRKLEVSYGSKYFVDFRASY
jgi:hypothetical protein